MQKSLVSRGPFSNRVSFVNGCCCRPGSRFSPRSEFRRNIWSEAQVLHHNELAYNDAAQGPLSSHPYPRADHGCHFCAAACTSRRSTGIRIGRRARTSHVDDTTRSKVRARAEHVFGDQKNAVGAEIGHRSRGCKTGMTNLVYNMRRFIILERIAEVGKRGVIDEIACDCAGLVYRIALLVPVMALGRELKTIDLHRTGFRVLK